MSEKPVGNRDTDGEKTVITETTEADDFYLLQLVNDNCITESKIIDVADLENFPINITLAPGKHADVIIYAIVRAFDPEPGGTP